MLKLKFYTTTDVDITHDPESGVPLKEPKPGKGNRITSVSVYVGGKFQPEAVLATATIQRYFKDLDIPVLAKKLVVEKLLANTDFSRKERTEIWNALWNHSAKVEALRHGAYKEEIRHIKEEDQWRKWTNQINRKIPAISNEAMNMKGQ